MAVRFLPAGIAAALLPLAAFGVAPPDDTGPAAQALPPLIQRLLDAIPGDAAVWRQYMSDQGVYVGEAGEVVGKAELLKGFHPFPAGLSGHIEALPAKITEFGDTAIAVFDARESETVFEQPITVTYLNTQAWRREAGHWRLIAAQVDVRARDPAPLPVDAQKLKDYAGLYALGQWRYAVAVHGGGLAGGSPGTEARPLIPVGENVFVEAGSPLGALRIFVRGAGGAVEHMVQRRKYADLDWVRVPASPVARP